MANDTMKDCERLLAEIRACKYAFPTQRVGQIIVNALPNGQIDPFYFEDAKLADLLKEYREKHAI